MASLARRIAPAAALGGLAVVIVAVADPAIGNLTGGGQAAAGGTAAGATAPVDGAEPAEPCSTSEEILGDAAMTPWGPVQVVVRADGSTLCAVQAVDWPQDDRKSERINEVAIPQIDANAAESGLQFDAVSGATYTSEAYRESLQSILDGLGR